MDDKTESHGLQDFTLDGITGSVPESPNDLGEGFRQQFRKVICERQAYYKPFLDGVKIPVDLLYGPILENGIQYNQIRFSEGGRVHDIKVTAQSLERITREIPIKL